VANMVDPNVKAKKRSLSTPFRHHDFWLSFTA
jgi:hypothetical protein